MTLLRSKILFDIRDIISMGRKNTEQYSAEYLYEVPGLERNLNTPRHFSLPAVVANVNE